MAYEYGWIAVDATVETEIVANCAIGFAVNDAFVADVLLLYDMALAFLIAKALNYWN